MQVQVVELKSDINELKQQVNFLASQMQIVESDVLVMKNKKPSSFFSTKLSNGCEENYSKTYQ